MDERAANEAFDAMLPAALRAVSGQFWSSVGVGRTVARWLDEVGVLELVDVGAGVGKLLVCVALFGNRARRLIGVEQRAGLVDVARRVARVCGVGERVAFLVGGVADVPVAAAYFLFNPFEENLHAPADWIDAAVTLSAEAYERDVAATEALLARAAVGTWVVLYNGFGGRLPDGYTKVRDNGDVLRTLELWRKMVV